MKMMNLIYTMFLAGFLKPTDLLEAFHLHLALSSLWRWCEYPYLIL